MTGKTTLGSFAPRKQHANKQDGHESTERGDQLIAVFCKVMPPGSQMTAQLRASIIIYVFGFENNTRKFEKE
jgi:hypothetical protein